MNEEGKMREKSNSYFLICLQSFHSPVAVPPVLSLKSDVSDLCHAVGIM